MSKLCPQCSTENQDAAKFCCNCAIPFKKIVNYYDAFISYRRDGGSETARLIKMNLEMLGNKNVFLDVDELGTGDFNENLLTIIEGAANFILILTPGSLDRCAAEGDWLRREIAHAMKQRRMIIPVMKEGFHFPSADTLPAEIRELPRLNGVFYNHRYMDAVIRKILQFMVRSEPAREISPAETQPIRPPTKDDATAAQDLVMLEKAEPEPTRKKKPGIELTDKDIAAVRAALAKFGHEWDEDTPAMIQLLRGVPLAARLDILITELEGSKHLLDEACSEIQRLFAEEDLDRSQLAKVLALGMRSDYYAPEYFKAAFSAAARCQDLAEILPPCIEQPTAFRKFYQPVTEFAQKPELKPIDLLRAMVEYCAEDLHVAVPRLCEAIGIWIDLWMTKPNELKEIFVQPSLRKVLEGLETGLTATSLPQLSANDQEQLFRVCAPLIMQGKRSTLARVLPNFKTIIEINIWANCLLEPDDKRSTVLINGYIEKLEPTIGRTFGRSLLLSKLPAFEKWWSSEGKRTYRDSVLVKYGVRAVELDV